MGDLRDVMLYLCQNVDDKDDLSNSRLTKLVYLADWRSALVRGRQITDIQWLFHRFGPYVHDVIDTARGDVAFDVSTTENMYGDDKVVIRARPGGRAHLDHDEKKILDFVLQRTRSKSYKAFIQLVYSTYPVVTQERYSDLDLVLLAQKYKKLMGRPTSLASGKNPIE